MSMIRDYLAITNRRYRLVCNALIPVGLGVLSMILTFVAGSSYVAVVALCIAAVFLTALEVAEDYFGFGAICVKGCLGMDYLKTSVMGKKMLCDALMADILVRPLRIALCMIFPGIAYGILVGSPVRPLIVSILLVADISVWSLNVTRYIQNLQIVSFVSMLMSAAVGAGAVYFGYMLESKGLVWLTVAGLILLLVLGTCVTYRHMCRKVEQSYEDID